MPYEASVRNTERNGDINGILTSLQLREGSCSIECIVRA
jgi:hypothetical protein